MSTATARLDAKQQRLEEAYAPPANFLEIDVVNAEVHGVAKKRYVDYEVRMKVHNVILHYGRPPSFSGFQGPISQRDFSPDLDLNLRVWS